MKLYIALADTKHCFDKDIKCHNKWVKYIVHEDLVKVGLTQRSEKVLK